MFEERTEIIREILEIFGTSSNIMALINSGENLSDYLKENVMIHPYEYDSILTSTTGNLGEFIDSLNRMASLIRRKQKLHSLYISYCQNFLGESVSYTDLSIRNDGTYKQFGHLNLRNEMGTIDYTPYLDQLGISGTSKTLKNNKFRKIHYS